MSPRAFRLVAAFVAAAACLVAAARGHAGAPPVDARLATLRLPGTPPFVALAQDVIALRFAIDPSLAANAGLFDDADRVPCFAPDTVAARLARLDRDLVAPKAMPWRTWSIDRQVDWRWIMANAEDARLQLADERHFTHRPAAWLEPLASTFIALVTYAPERVEQRARLARDIPRMVAEMRAVALAPTVRDVTMARGVADGILATLRADAAGPDRDPAIAALTGYLDELQGRQGLPEFQVIGRERYEERLRRALLVTWGGDGGSMNPPPPVGRSNVGWWNVEHMDTTWTVDQKANRIAITQGFHETWMGPYAAHEGVPGHHLQLSIARLNPNPLRWIFQDNVLCEGWAMFAEEVFWRAGGLGDTPTASCRALGSWRSRIRRVVYDVNIERGNWTLQRAADYKRNTEPGKGKVDEDIMRSINWPTQLIGYFTGKMQLMDLRREYRAKLGSAYSDREFNDAVLAEGSIPVALIRARLLGQAVPEP